MYDLMWESRKQYFFKVRLGQLSYLYLHVTSQGLLRFPFVVHATYSGSFDLPVVLQQLPIPYSEHRESLTWHLLHSENAFYTF